MKLTLKGMHLLAVAIVSIIVLSACENGPGKTETTEKSRAKSKGITAISRSKVKEEKSKTCYGVVESIGPSAYPRSHCDNCATLYPVGSKIYVDCDDCEKLHTGQPAIPVNCIESGVNTPDGCMVTFSSVDKDCKVRN
jgi:hypothetical protein